MPPEAGALIGVYELIAPLGSGGMGDVYRARDTRLGRTVAIKFISRELHGNATAEARLDREARLASSLNHPGIVTVFDVGRHDDVPYVVMEFIDGRSLAAALADERLRVREVVDIGLQIADALASAHDAGIVHRDLKPQNVMLTVDRRVKIVDFGLSKITAPASATDATISIADGITADHAVLGTAGYMAPEQVLSQHADGRADQFALGAILYEMLSGRRAFRRDTPFETMTAIVQDDPPPLSQLRGDVPPALIAIVNRCLAKRPEDRYASTRDLARDLRDVSEQVVADTRSSPGAARPAMRQAWWPLAAGIVISVVLLGAPLGPGSTTPSAQGPLAHTATRYIAVLPLANVTQDAADQVFADGLTETLTSSLTQLEQFQTRLRVVPASEVRSAHITSAKEARQSFGVTLAISGSMQRLPSTLRLTLNLVDTLQLAQLSSRTIDMATSKDVITQETVVSAAVALLALELDPGAQHAIAAGGTNSPGAYELYVKGRGYLQRFDRGADNVDLAIDALSRAIATDPHYALAHSALGEAYSRKFEATHQPAWLDRASEHAEEALRIDSRLAPVHVTLAMIARSRGRYEEAIALAQRAVELDPVSSAAHGELGRAYDLLNRPDEAEATYKKAIAARPDDWLAYNALGSFYMARSRFADAESAFQHVIELTPDNTRGYNNLGAVYFRMQRADDAARVWEQSSAIRPSAAAASNLGSYYFARGRYAESARALERAVALTPTSFTLRRNLAAALYWSPGERDKSRAAFEKAIELGESARTINPRQPALLAELADSYASVGAREPALACAAGAERLGAANDGEVAFTLAGAYETLGDRAVALEWLKRAIKSGYPVSSIERSPTVAELRKDRRYSSFVSKSFTEQEP